MKSVPRVVRTPTATNMYPMLLSPIFLTRDGVIMEITRFISQLSTVATDTDLSCMISAMYNQVIGPDENSNTVIKARTKITVGMVHTLVSSPTYPSESMSDYLVDYFKLQTPTITRMNAMRAFILSIIVLLPSLNRSSSPPNVAIKFTSPTKKVIISPLIPPRDEKIVLE